MQRFRMFLTTAAMALLASPVLAQQQAPGAQTPIYGYGPMWHGGGPGFHPGMVLAPFVMLLALIGFVAVIMALVRFFGYRGHHHWRGPMPDRGGRYPGRAIDILEERFARGEIDKAEFEDRRKLLGR